MTISPENPSNFCPVARLAMREFEDAFDDLYYVLRNPHMTVFSLRRWIRSSQKIVEHLSKKEIDAVRNVSVYLTTKLTEIYEGKNKDQFNALVWCVTEAALERASFDLAYITDRICFALKEGRPEPGSLPDQFNDMKACPDNIVHTHPILNFYF